MLRLRPSELTLSSDDIEETFRRMARRQKPLPPAHATDRPLKQPGRPVLRHGPQRSARDAYRTLGDIPILRPQPFQAIHTSVEDDLGEDLEDNRMDARERIDSGPEDTTFPPTQRTPTTTRDRHLPIRTRHSAGREHIQGMRFAPTDIFEDPEALGPFPLPSTPDDLGLDVGSTNSSDIENDDVFASVPPELRGGGGGRKRHRPGAREPDLPDTPRSHNQGNASSRPRRNRPRKTTREPPTVYLQGYFTEETDTVQYHFKETLPWPQSEPYRRTGHTPITRSVSTSNIPVFPLAKQQQPTPSAPQNSSWDAVPSDPLSEKRQTSVNRPIRRVHSSSASRSGYASYVPATTTRQNPEPRRFGSGTSSASLAYSYYELPDRNSSGDQSQQSNGNAGSRLSSQGAYHSIRASEIRSRHEMVRPSSSRGSRHSSPNLPATAQHAASPLPMVPYSRNQPAQVVPQTFTALSGQLDGGGQDAASAAIHGGPSPLDLLTDSLSRLVTDGDARQTPTIQAFSRQDEIINQQMARIEIERQAGHGQMARQRSNLNASSWGNRLHHIEDDPYARGSTAHRQLQYLPTGSPPVLGGHPSPTVYPSTQSRSSSHGFQASPTEASAMARIDVRSRLQSERGQFRLPDYHSLAARPPPYRHTGNPARQLPPTNRAPDSLSSRDPHTEAPHPRRIHQPQPPIRRPFPGLNPQTFASSPMAVPNRRSVRANAQLQNQENSGEAEMELMRLEQDAVNARYDEERHGEIMDETPPRIGRMERFTRDRHGAGED